MLKLKPIISHLSLKRLLSTLSPNVLEPLNNRSLIRVAGPDVSNFLQGLITNDIEHLSSGPGCMYTMFLNSAGRILYDAIVYRNSENNTYLVECDTKSADILQKHLKLYRVRRKIDITSLSDELKIYALFDTKNFDLNSNQKLANPPLETPFKAHKELLIYRDPRITNLGLRIIAKSDVNVPEQLGDNFNVTQNSSSKNYRWLRYSLGVGEGVEDLPPGECFPLECNCDYLHGVSFHKGCYVGQELTARVHHTGVVRKRLMPLHFSKIPTKYPDEKIVQENVSLGKLRGIEGDVGLASLRIAKTLAFKELKLGDGVAVTSRPSWWPQEAPKEKIKCA
ncbi:putative transferase CAF17 homolog, mitochondrial [Tribolium castaneum]|uniref:Transferase CAF17, mitochondrial-like Protein n=1 Tax=Tribolium castaneum TaxID=7070 RepID=D6WMF8_TRICA|nr:PREDICTED: putative transferase CAF17 homolog, mitochondrial [Tribolium castaneum]XP_008193991.1 PREDICTED: putative transferase CAF17 homolog, mitochondrial [Tribolium castaneum]EFA03307.1 Putative transferase CAF17, mitochondrial-like Protein [Tribolium castaneum]|eukprot:XP_008193990.1 PREDICTED: putative transferase CAF17 homolog, mitochondrial [Tribolium castaneum]